MTARLCSAVGCYLAAGTTGRCPAHARALARRRDPRTTTARGYGASYQAFRKRVLAEEDCCWLCGAPGTEDDPLQADHVVPLSMGGRRTRDNLRAAHRSCNVRRGGRNRLRPGGGSKR